MNNYKIKTVEDFFQVPEDRISQCLKEFEIYLRTKLFMDSFVEDLQLPVKHVPVFDWTDDNILEVKIGLNNQTAK